MSLAIAMPSLQVAAVLFVGWFQLLALFHTFPQVDILTARAFFQSTPCPETATAGQVCGSFFYSNQPDMIAVRKVLFYLPWAAAVLMIALLLRDRQPAPLPARNGILVDMLDALLWGPRTLVARLRSSHDSKPSGSKQLQRSAADAPRMTVSEQACPPADTGLSAKLGLMLVSLLLGPYVLVNLLIKEFSGRPRPYQTDIFGGDMVFMPAGSFGGECARNCSFVSGEGAAAGWLFCLILLLPSRNRLLLVPLILFGSLFTPALRVAFGGHYLSDVILGWLSSLVVVALVMGVAEVLRLMKKREAGVET